MADSPNTETDKKTLQGAEPPVATPEQRDEAVDLAFSYRGDVTIETADGRELEGFVYDRRQIGGKPHLRMMLKASGAREVVPCESIRRLALTGKDPAAGKSWETWVRKYVEKKQRGESANLYPDVQ
ncbi:MAG: hypothetical protein ACOCTI_00135 [Phycisphaeraceae bacterium]